MIKKENIITGGKMTIDPAKKNILEKRKIVEKDTLENINKNKLSDTKINNIIFNEMDETYMNIIDKIMSHDDSGINSIVENMNIKNDLIKKQGDSLYIGDLEFSYKPELKTDLFNKGY